jgi:predicted nucleic acid-binding protein
MATKRILVDSSVIIDLFRKKNKETAQFYQLMRSKEQLFISSLTVYELLCGAKSNDLLHDTESILNLLNILDFDYDTASKAATLYKQLKVQNKLIDTVDILIAATALTHNLNVATLNKDHFSRFPDLNIVE